MYRDTIFSQTNLHLCRFTFNNRFKLHSRIKMDFSIMSPFFQTEISSSSIICLLKKVIFNMPCRSFQHYVINRNTEIHQDLKSSDETGLVVSISILQSGNDTSKLHQCSGESGGCRINTWTNLTPAVRPAVLHTAALPLCGQKWVLRF